MCGTIFCVAAVVLGIEVGWQRTTDGELEYIIQIEPEMLETLRGGEVIHSDIPLELKGVRSYRIQVGRGKLPRAGVEPITPDRAETTETAIKEPPPQMTNQGAKPARDVFTLPFTSSQSPSERSAGDAPGVLGQDPDSRPITEQPASYNRLSPSARTSTPAVGSVTDSSSEPSEELWYPMVIAAGAAAGFCAAFVYLLWIHLGARARYRALLAERLALGSSAEPPGF